MSSSSEDEILNLGGATATEAKTAMLKLASTSRHGYMRKYENFIIWKNLKGAKSFSEEVLLDYFKELAKSKVPSTLWAIYSMLKATLNANENIQIAKYSNLRAFLKQQAIGCSKAQSKVFTASNIETFLTEAPDHNYLCLKVALIFGVNGACQNIELVRLRITDIEKHSNQLLLVNVRSSPRKLHRSFLILDKDVEIVEKYMALRPKNMRTDRFFISYRFGKCRHQVVGKNNIQKYPRRIADYLKLPNPEMYTGHCFRKTAASFSTSSPVTVFQQFGLRDRKILLRDKMDKKKLQQSALTHSPGVTVKVERAESEIPFDFIDVEIPPQPSQPPSPSPAPRRRLRSRPNPLFSLTMKLLHRQLKRDEEREREEHKRQMEWLRIEARRVEAEAENNAVLSRIADVARAFLERPAATNSVMAPH